MSSYVLRFEEVRKEDLLLVGGKGANLGEMTAAGFPVPGGFCITTDAFREFLTAGKKIQEYFDRMEQLSEQDLEEARILGEQIREYLLEIAIPEAVEQEIVNAWRECGLEYTYAVRSSATAEDLPNASFAGQQDTYLNVRGDELLKHIKMCWASLFTDRAILYRAKNHFDHRQVLISVVIQRMVQPGASGIMFTADPITGNRHVVSIDAGFGLGEALVSGLVSADLYKVKNGVIVEKNISSKKLAIYSLPEGGTITKELSLDEQQKQALSNEQILQLAALGRKIEAHYGQPQDVEYCVENNKLYIVQSRPITTLFPVAVPAHEDYRVYVSIGHIQVMLDAMKPLALSFFRTMIPEVILKTAGGRLYVDLTDVLRSGFWRRILMIHAGNLDEQIYRALEEVVDREEFKHLHGKKQSLLPLAKLLFPVAGEAIKSILFGNPHKMHTIIEGRMKKSIEKLHADLSELEGAELIHEVREEAKDIITPLVEVVYGFVTFIISTMLLEKAIAKIENASEEINHLAKSQSGNIMREMSLSLGDVADVVRKFPELQEYLKNAKDDSFFLGLEDIEGGEEFKKVFESFLENYGMRCPGEIDITRPRWKERPTMLVSGILSDVENFTEKQHRIEFEKGLSEAKEAEIRILSQMHGIKRKIVKRLIKVYRSAAGLREHHKHMITLLFHEYKMPVMREAAALVQKGLLKEAGEVYWLELEELIAICEGAFDGDIQSLITERKQEFARIENMGVPRVMISDGEIIIGKTKKGDFPKGALVGCAASSGGVEGIARVILTPEDARLGEGEILIAPNTDPGWTPLFQAAGAIVTEVGGLMTHGSVVAREYGIPAVVGVDRVTELVKDGQKIRVDGSRGFVEVLDK